MGESSKPDLGKLLLGLAITGIGVAAHVARSKKHHQTSFDFGDLVGNALNTAAKGGHAEWEKMRQDEAALREKIGDGAHDPGALVIYPASDGEITVPEWEYGRAKDNRTGTFLSGDRFGGYMKLRPRWTFHHAKGNYPILAHLHGTYSRGWRGAGPALAITITHAHRPGYFPWTDSLYADELPLDRIAMLMQAANRMAPPAYARLVVIDNREACRAEHQRRAAAESPDRIRLKDVREGAERWTTVTSNDSHAQINPAVHDGAVVVLGEPDLTIGYDPAAQATFELHGDLCMTIHSAGDRDFSYQIGRIARGDQIVAQVTLHTANCWRPGHGETRLIHLNRTSAPRTQDGETRSIDPVELPFARIWPLLNRHPHLFFRDEHLGKAVLVDTRANPINFYYG
jgi:hypothetical protein